MTIPDGISELFREKSLFSIYRRSVFLSENRSDIVLKGLSFVVIFLLVGYINFFSREHMYIIFDALNKWSDIGFNYSVQILGFLLAGFTIFATTTDIKVFVGLSKITNKGRSFNELKFLFFSFLRVFIVHLTVLISCVVVSMFKSIIKPLIGMFISNSTLEYEIRSCLASIISIFIGCFIISALLQLKTFVWNLYQSVIFSIASSASLASSSTSSPQRGGVDTE